MCKHVLSILDITKNNSSHFKVARNSTVYMEQNSLII